MNSAGEDDAEEDPERAGEVAELGGEHGSHKGAGAGDGGEVMAEYNPRVGLHEIATVLVEFAGSGPAVLDGEGLGFDPL